ncbi:restriction endonuclease subunit S [Frigidibacter sp. ROC022]|uniref:restriction endonuclease subunit S n=1 Tax=Frigidibacter sp. ROC022 TaxID=2971796 RepID=UPI00215B49DC|nr:restriction endonuclease subunit S [Frigidibacter sp. ROC022]MCR8724111.1 restriction endonuclease subunit S [Frigidibacter sp. ROC022]
MSVAGWPRYDSYKDSGEGWIGEIPAHWDLQPVRANFAFRNEKNDPVITEEVLSLSIAQGVTLYSEEGRGGNKRKDDLTGYKIARPGDIVLNSMNVIVGAVGRSKYFGAISPVYYALFATRPDTNVDYYDRVLSNSVFQKNLLRHGKGILMKLSGTGQLNTIRMKIAQNDLKNVLMPAPPASEQAAIVSFLDEKCAKVDEAVRIRERQIALLRERRQILIQQAVTRGLNPAAPMKDSGIDWIGKIPAHWEVRRFKYLFMQSRLPVRPNDGVVTCFRDGQVTLRSNRRLEGYTEAIIEGGYQGIRKGQLVLNSMDAFEGAIGVSDSDGKCTPEYVICDPIGHNLSQHYFAYLLREMALARYIQVICNAVRQRAVRIRYNNLAQHFMIVPPHSEQLAIVGFIEDAKGRFEAAISIKEQQIAALREYKASLIDAAVTGKIRVTAQAAGHAGAGRETKLSAQA